MEKEKKANFYIDLNRDFSSLKPKVIMGLTSRQIVCFIGAGIMGIPFYIKTHGVLGDTFAMLFMVLIMSPWFAFALYEKNGMKLEEILRDYFRENILKSKVRKISNVTLEEARKQCMQYEKLMKEHRKKGFYKVLEEVLKKRNKEYPLLKGILEKYSTLDDGERVVMPWESEASEELRRYSAKRKGTQKICYKHTLSATDSIPFEEIYPEGILHLEKDKYAVMICFQDINYDQADVENQKMIWDYWCQFYDSLNYEAEYQFVYQVRYESIKEMAEQLRFRITLETRHMEEVVKELNQYLYGILRKGNNALQKSMYLVITYHAKEKKFRDKGKDLQKHFVTELHKKMGMEAQAIDGYEWLCLLYTMLNEKKREDRKPSFRFQPRSGIPIKSQLCRSDLVFGKEPDVFQRGREYGRVYYIQMDNNKTPDKFITSLLELDEEITISLHVKPQSRMKSIKIARRHLSDMQKMVIDEQKSASNSGYSISTITGDLKQGVKQAEEMLEDISADGCKIFYGTITLLITAGSIAKLDKIYETVKAVVQGCAFELIPLEYKQEDSFFTTLPIGNNRLSMKREFTTPGIGGMLPFSIQELTQYGESLIIGFNRLTGHVITADLKKRKNPNMLVLGTPGRGKSFAVKMMILQVYLKTRDHIFICDVEGEYGGVTSLVHGQIIEFNIGSETYVNPLDMPVNMESFERSRAEKIDFVLSMFETMMSKKEHEQPEDKSIIDRALRKLYEPFKESRNIDDLPILSDLYEELGSMEEPRAKVLQNIMEIYVHGSLNLFNHRTNIDIQNRVVCLNIRKLPSNLRDLAMLYMQEIVWNRVEENRERKIYTRYYMDEFHVLLRNARTAAYSVDIWKRFRKWLGMPCGITQNVTGFMASPEISTIFENTDTYMILGQDKEEAELLAEHLNLSQKQYECIRTQNNAEGMFLYGEEYYMPFDSRIPVDGVLYKNLHTSYGDEG